MKATFEEGRPMSNIDKQALVIPQREKHDWSQAVMRDCDFCQQWALTVRHSDGGCICASCCDSEYTTALSSALVVALDELEHYKSREERVTKLVLDNSASWDELYKKLEAAEKRIAELSKLLADIQQGRPGGVYFNKWDAQISNVLRAAAAGKGEAS